MLQAKFNALLALGPVVTGTIGIVVVSLVVVGLLSVVIKRRNRARNTAQTWTRAQVAAPRPTAETIPVDMQERLRRLTDSGDERKGGVAPGNVSGAPAAGRPVPAPMTMAPGDVFEDRTQFFGDADDSDATAFFADQHAQDDATRFFGDEQEVEMPSDATGFFAAPALPAHTRTEEREDATRFFGHEGGEQDGQPALLHPSATQFFTPAELDKDEDVELVDVAAGRQTGGLHALPAATKADLWDTDEERAPAHEAGGLGRVRERLSSVVAPGIMALSVIDGAGRVLAGETDVDLTGELRSLMAESGQGSMADVEQPVRLADDSTGAILLLPTGADALLGALIRDADDPQATRQSLRAAAHDIGDALRRAS